MIRLGDNGGAGHGAVLQRREIIWTLNGKKKINGNDEDAERRNLKVIKEGERGKGAKM